MLKAKHATVSTAKIGVLSQYQDEMQGKGEKNCRYVIKIAYNLINILFFKKWKKSLDVISLE